MAKWVRQLTPRIHVGRAGRTVLSTLSHRSSAIA
jgi:hypothetical protein